MDNNQFAAGVRRNRKQKLEESWGREEEEIQFFSAVTERVRKNIETVQSKLSNSGTNKKKCQISEETLLNISMKGFSVIHTNYANTQIKLCMYEKDA